MATRGLNRSVCCTMSWERSHGSTSPLSAYTRIPQHPAASRRLAPPRYVRDRARVLLAPHILRLRTRREDLQASVSHSGAPAPDVTAPWICTWRISGHVPSGSAESSTLRLRRPSHRLLATRYRDRAGSGGSTPSPSGVIRRGASDSRSSPLATDRQTIA